MPIIRSSQARKSLLACSVALIAGCTASGPVGLSTQQADQNQQQAGQGQQQQQDPLGLSQDQQQKLGQAFAVLEPSAEQKKLGDNIRNILLSDNIDVATLAEDLDATHKSLIQNVDKIISAFVSLRETLTPDQKNKLTTMLQQELNRQPQAIEFPSELKLSPDQQAALSSLKISRKNLNQALIDYLSNGDDNALRIAVTNDIASLPKPADVAKALSSLNKEQRQKMFGDQQQGQQQGS